MQYTVTVTDWSQRRGYRNSGRGWRVRCFGMPDNDWNALGQTVAESFHRTESSARKRADELVKSYNARLA
jgi:hypothetical protein